MMLEFINIFDKNCESQIGNKKTLDKERQWTDAV